ncbi:MAG: septum formation protein Maf [Sphingomonas sp. 28-62-20]|uniref:Maf family protein n=1 Tax=Sphingomonas sp. 28-62-20 TaxID=1970433 RepID=UPI000BD5D12B|nr:MAG: septum formation protein Maf [Sphingomonas sp. 28-62-20]
MTLILASHSASRQAMLAAAGVPFQAVPSHADEAAMKAALQAEGASGRTLADALAELKALRVAARHPDALVLGSDSLLVRDDGVLLDKPVDRDDAAAQLRALSGKRHQLVSAAVIVEAGRPVWRFVDSARLTVRSLSDNFIDTYLDAEWPAIADCVGCFRIEGLGVQLFDRVDGSHFTILGMPLLPVLDYLRLREKILS